LRFPEYSILQVIELDTPLEVAVKYHDSRYAIFLPPGSEYIQEEEWIKPDCLRQISTNTVTRKRVMALITSIITETQVKSHLPLNTGTGRVLISGIG
jgi:hypothetical protein